MAGKSKSARVLVTSVSGPGATPTGDWKYQGDTVFSSDVSECVGMPVRAQKSMYFLAMATDRMGRSRLPSYTSPFHHEKVILPGLIQEVSWMTDGSLRQ